MNSLYISMLRRAASTIPQKRPASSPCLRHFSSNLPRRDLEQTEITTDAITPPPLPQTSPAATAAVEEADETLPETLTSIIQDDNRILPTKRTGPIANHDRTAGTVVGAGKMSKTVKVKFVKQHWNQYLRKVGTIYHHTTLEACLLIWLW